MRKHAIDNTCQLIAREFSEIYEVFSMIEEPDEDAKNQISLIVNDIFIERMNKHHML